METEEGMEASPLIEFAWDKRDDFMGVGEEACVAEDGAFGAACDR